MIVALVSLAAAAAFAGDIQFNRDIRPILSENCSACHGPDKNKRKAKLRLDVREVAIQSEAIVPGKPEESKLIEHIFAKDPDDLMPPPDSGKKLTDSQKELLRRWIAEGAPYEPHWSYITPRRPEAPRARDSHWARNPIDAFILHALESKGLQPSREADRRTLIRRVSLDLIGLPPTPEEVRAFLADSRPDAYERLVARLLSSPHFGERMAVPWLDVVRFSDTVGYHGDQNQNIFPYRDYVISAFNRNKPFDQFTIEQVAGDLLPNPSVEARVASGFNRLNMMTREGGAQPKEYMAKYAADRVRTVSMAWMGSTMGCCECHDHKYDPFTTRDFYKMEAFFADLKQWGVYADYAYTPNPELAGLANDGPFPPELLVESPCLEARLNKIRAQENEVWAAAAAKRKTDKAQQAAFSQWRSDSLKFFQQWSNGWAAPMPQVTITRKGTNGQSDEYTVQGDAIIALSGKVRDNLKISVPLDGTWLSAIRLEIVPHPGAIEKASRRKKRNGASISLAAAIETPPEGTNTHKATTIKLTFFDAEADHKEERYVSGFPIIGVRDTWQISTDHEKQTAVWLLDKPMRVQPGQRLVADVGNALVASARLSFSPFAGTEPLLAGGGEPLRKSIATGGSHSSKAALAESAYLLSALAEESALKELRKLQKHARECRNGMAYTMISESREPVTTRVLPRGNWQNESGDVVEPAPPHFLPQIPKAEGRRLTRLDLARWLVSSENPLTARAVVNRLWKQFYGTGISAVVDDLGAQGEWPVHPELLDWLACEFMKPSEAIKRGGIESAPPHAWDVKHVVALMVLSSSYRQVTDGPPHARELDPNDRLLYCQAPRRLEAEFVRDNALRIAGLLNEEVGGPSAHPYQPAGYYANIQFPDRDYVAETDARQYRRGVYMHWQRTFLHPMLANFDAPSREECTANRVISNTPQQALTLLNDPSFVEAARVFAQHLLAEPTRSDTERLDRAFERALARPVREAEKQSLLSFLAAQREHYRDNSEEADKLMRVGVSSKPAGSEATELASWTQVCRVILNLQETITRY